MVLAVVAGMVVKVELDVTMVAALREVLRTEMLTCPVNLVAEVVMKA